jgi:hypothetical protein
MLRVWSTIKKCIVITTRTKIEHGGELYQAKASLIEGSDAFARRPGGHPAP